MSIVLDSDILIDVLRKFEKAKGFFEKTIKKEERIYFSAITETEIISGKACNELAKKQNTLHLLSLFTKILVDNKIAQTAGDFRRNYNLLTPDAIIAATALHTKSKLITRNLKDFQKVKEIIVESPY